MMQRITPFLWFDGQAEDAARFYTAIFHNSKLGSVRRCGDQGPGPKGSVMSVELELDGQSLISFNGGPQFPVTPAISMFVRCETQDEIDYYWHRLLDGGKPVQCGWLTDRFGVSWQVVPDALGEMLQDPDPRRSANVMKAMMQMIKLDLAKLQAAYEQP